MSRAKQDKWRCLAENLGPGCQSVQCCVCVSVFALARVRQALLWGLHTFGGQSDIYLAIRKALQFGQTFIQQLIKSFSVCLGESCMSQELLQAQGTRISKLSCRKLNSLLSRASSDYPFRDPMLTLLDLVDV